MEFSDEIINKAKQAASAEELKKLVPEEGLEITAEEAEKLFSILNGHEELTEEALTDEELEEVAGGYVFSLDACRDCGYEKLMPGSRRMYQCLKCGSYNTYKKYGIGWHG